MKRKYIVIGVILLCALDLGLKFLAKAYLMSSVSIIPNVLYLTYIENQGAAWGMFSGARIFFIIISFGCLYILIKKMLTKPITKPLAIAYTLVMGGLLGNLIERILYGYVTDYIQIIIGSYHFPIFNLADMLIVIGVILLLIIYIRGEKHEF